MERFTPGRKGDLFKKGQTTDLENWVKKEISKTIQSLDDNSVLNVSEENYISYLTDEFRIECPVVLFDKKWVETRRVLLSNEYPDSYSSLYQEDCEKTVYRLCIPYVGDREILQYRPSTFTLSLWMNFLVFNDKLIVDILDLDYNVDNIKSTIQSYTSTLQRMMDYLNNDIEKINSSLSLYIQQIFLAQKTKIKKEQDVISSIGIPIKSENILKTYSVPTVKKRFAKPVVTNLQKNKSLISTMAEEEYLSILQCINEKGKNIERYPSTVYDQDEETIRYQFLSTLSTTFESYSITGESFNHEGKTDIMIKQGNELLFIAECKIWKGQKQLLKAIDQLMSYLTWRDTKTALLIFNKKTDINTVIHSIQEEIPNHPNYEKLIDEKDNSWFNYSFKRTDTDETVKMAVMIFDFRRNT